MPGILGALLAGAAQGYGTADNQNVMANNTQVMAENVEAQKAAVEDMFQQAREQRSYAMAGRYRNEVIAPVMQHDVPLLLNAQKMVMPGTDLTQEQKDNGYTVAPLTEVAKAQGIALNSAGINPELAQKGGIDIANQEEKTAGYVEGLQTRDIGKAQIGADAKNYATDTRSQDLADKLASQERTSAARLGTLTPGQAALLIRDNLAPPDTIAIARSVLTASANGALNAGLPPGTIPIPSAPAPLQFHSLPLR